MTNELKMLNEFGERVTELCAIIDDLKEQVERKDSQLKDANAYVLTLLEALEEANERTIELENN